MKNSIKKIIIWIVGSILGILILIGSFSGNGKGTFWPFYVNKVGPSWGINVAAATLYAENSNHKGLSVSLLVEHASKFTGGDFSLFKCAKSESKGTGFSVSLVHFGETDSFEDSTSLFNGVELSLLNLREAVLPSGNKRERDVNGLQIGLVNFSSGNCVQVGVFNQLEEQSGEKVSSIILNLPLK